MPQDNVINTNKQKEPDKTEELQPGNVTLETLSRRIKDLENRVKALE